MQQHLNNEKQREESRRAQKEHEEREEKFRSDRDVKSRRKKKILGITICVLIILGALVTYAALLPGKYDDFAMCLTEKGAVMQGENWCQYTQAQKAMFGKSFKYINYHVKTDLKLRPTWVIDEKTYEKVQSFQRLSALTGCEY